MITLFTALGILCLCTAIRRQLTRPGRRMPPISGRFVQLTFLWNEGAAFGLSLPRRLLLFLSGAALPIFWLLRRCSPLGTGLLLGGGISNFWERVRHGRVFDYLCFPKAPGRLRRYVYNLADLAVFLGAALLLLGKSRK